MKMYLGRILVGDEVIIDGAEIRIETIPGSGRLYEWHGWFTVPDGVSLDRKQSTYDIELHDRRKGHINVTNFNLGGVEFQGMGELK